MREGVFSLRLGRFVRLQALLPNVQRLRQGVHLTVVSTLAEVGIDKRPSARAQKLAALPELRPRSTRGGGPVLRVSEACPLCVSRRRKCAYCVGPNSPTMGRPRRRSGRF